MVPHVSELHPGELRVIREILSRTTTILDGLTPQHPTGSSRLLLLSGRSLGDPHLDDAARCREPSPRPHAEGRRDASWLVAADLLAKENVVQLGVMLYRGHGRSPRMSTSGVLADISAPRERRCPPSPSGRDLRQRPFRASSADDLGGVRAVSPDGRHWTEPRTEIGRAARARAHESAAHLVRGSCPGALVRSFGSQPYGFVELRAPASACAKPLRLRAGRSSPRPINSSASVSRTSHSHSVVLTQRRTS